MSLIGVKRLQQSVFQHATAANRAAGAGGGSGFVVKQALVNKATGTISQTFSVLQASEVAITNSSATFSLARPAEVEIVAQVQMAVTAGTDYAYVLINVDGTDLTGATSGDGPKGYYTATIFTVIALGPGLHTVKLTGYVGVGTTTGIVVAANVFAFQLGA